MNFSILQYARYGLFMKEDAPDGGGKKLASDLQIAVFKGKEIRRTIHDNEWWFSVVDVVSALTDSSNPRDCWQKMKIREKSEAGIELSTTEACIT